MRRFILREKAAHPSQSTNILSTANLVLQDTIERIFVRDLYADIPRGIFLVRGENVLLLGEIVRSFLILPKQTCLTSSPSQDLDKDEYIPEQYRQASPEEVHALFIKEAQDRKRLDKITQTKMQELGFEVENVGEVLL